MKIYYDKSGDNVFDVMPLTFHIKSGSHDDPDFNNFAQYYNDIKQQQETDVNASNVWIIKPGEFSNRGYGIRVSEDIEEIQAMLNTQIDDCEHTFIVQKYIDRPFLIRKRKFDIRIFSMITCCEGYNKGYFYNEGYIRTSSKEFTLDNLDNIMVHLTNDAIQVHDEDYGKFEMANKLSFDDFQKYLDYDFSHLSIDFKRDLLPQIRSIVTDTMRASHKLIDPYERSNTFEIFGYDFMIDQDFKIYLIEVNTNPCLEQ